MNKRHYEHTLPNIRGSLSNTYDVPDTLPQCPEVREYVNIEPLLSEADKKLLAETECDKGESLLERIAEGDCCRVRARCWTTDKESGKWMRVLSVDI